MYYAGIDIGGTKCAAVLGKPSGNEIVLLSKERFATEGLPYEMLGRLADSLEKQIERQQLPKEELACIGISCGGPLSSRTGTILSPPNLPGWDQVEAADFFTARFGVKAVLQNDANACAVAEWKFGAGQGLQNVIFLTFGTGLGAGLILDGRLYCGSDDMAGELGHMRLAPDGPVGFGKAGSMEGFCSGGGIAELGRMLSEKERSRGHIPRLLEAAGTPEQITAKLIAELADNGDELSREIYRISGEKLGTGLSVLVDLLNPEMIIIGSVFARSHHLLWEPCRQVMERECLPVSLKSCQVVPSKLGEAIGDIAALAIATAG